MAEHGMEKIAKLTDQERAEIFRVTAANRGMPNAAVEKDFWVCWTLHRLFSNNDLSNQILFKGGTSLSKCYGLIERFSEDIDLILNWDLLTNEDPYLERTNTQQDMFNKRMEANAQTYIKGTMLKQISMLMGDYCQFNIDAKNKPRSIIMAYPKSFDSPYIKPIIELEIGPMSGMTPNNEFTITPYCKDVIADVVGGTELTVKAIEAKKTFWDKICILHVEAHRSVKKAQPERYSRHYYDVYQMLSSNIVEEAMNDLPLLSSVIEFKHKFYPQSWANYNSAKNGVFKLVPEKYWIAYLEKDYAQMNEMIFGDCPSFETIISAVESFEKRLNAAHDH